MKKTTVISITIMLFSFCALQACREYEMDIEPDHGNQASKEYRQRMYQKIEADSVKAPVLYFDGKESQVADPPPKDKDQWRYKSDKAF